MSEALRVFLTLLLWAPCVLWVITAAIIIVRVRRAMKALDSRPGTCRIELAVLVTPTVIGASILGIFARTISIQQLGW